MHRRLIEVDLVALRGYLDRTGQGEKLRGS